MEAQPAPAEDAKAVRRTTNGPRSIHPAIKKVWLVTGIVTVVAIGAGLAMPAGAALLILRKSGVGTGVLVAVGSLAIAVWIGLLVLTLAKIHRQWMNWTYEVREHDVILSWGVFWRTRRHVARDRIQHLDINSGPLDRRFGLVQVGVHTAGAAGTVGVIPGLTPEEAEDLRDMILESQAEHV